MKIGCLSYSSQAITLVALFFNVISNFIVISVTDREIVGDLGSNVGIGVAVNLAEMFLSLVAIIFIHDKPNSRVTIVIKCWSLGCIVLLLFLDIFVSYLIVLNSYQQILDSGKKIRKDLNEDLNFQLSLLVFGLICYCAFKLYVAAIALSYASDKTNFTLTDDDNDVERNALRNDDNDVPPLSPPPSYDNCLTESAPEVLETPPPPYDAVAVIFKY
ncbi:uncharacterized protein LOC135834627 [Planococcus citri]|uniref:uncharacterized protein LOC135834627 n=1 Tax=Planococcus citri TaxID=170843 RepID=UPI0031F9A7F8